MKSLNSPYILEVYNFDESKNLLHRDISTTNILVKQYDDANIIKIADFGLVKDKYNYLIKQGS